VVFVVCIGYMLYILVVIVWCVVKLCVLVSVWCVLFSVYDVLWNVDYERYVVVCVLFVV